MCQHCPNQFPSQYGNAPLECAFIEPEVEVATSTRKHWLVYCIYQGQYKGMSEGGGCVTRIY